MKKKKYIPLSQKKSFLWIISKNKIKFNYVKNPNGNSLGDLSPFFFLICLSLIFWRSFTPRSLSISLSHTDTHTLSLSLSLSLWRFCLSLSPISHKFTFSQCSLSLSLSLSLTHTHTFSISISCDFITFYLSHTHTHTLSLSLSLYLSPISKKMTNNLARLSFTFINYFYEISRKIVSTEF